MKQHGVLASHDADLFTGQAFSQHSFTAAGWHSFELRSWCSKRVCETHIGSRVAGIAGM
jgi:hypothetical protein